MLDFLGASAVVVWDHMAKTDAGEVSCASARCAADEDCRCTCAVDIDGLDDAQFYQVMRTLPLSAERSLSLTRARYRLQYAPPESDEIKDRLIQRSDDTEAKMGNRIVQFHKNVDAVKGEYASITETVSSNRGKADIFVDVAAAIEKRVFGK